MGDNLRFFASLAPETRRSHGKDQGGNNPEFDRLANLSPGSPDFHGFEYNTLDWAEYEMRRNQGDPTIPKRKRRAEKAQNQTSVPSPVSTETPRVQAKLEIGRADDPLEREADEIADRVMRSPAPSVTAADRPAVFRTDWRPKGHVMPKRYVNAGGTERPDHLFDALHRSRGNKLSESERDFFEPRFGRSFSDVRVHTGPEAATAAESIQAKAFATGNDVFFGEGEYQPSTDEGKRLMAHELAHVVQQSSSEAQIVRRQPQSRIVKSPGENEPGEIIVPKDVLLETILVQIYEPEIGELSGTDKHIITSEVGRMNELPEKLPAPWDRNIRAGAKLRIPSVSVVRTLLLRNEIADEADQLSEKERAEWALFIQAIFEGTLDLTSFSSGVGNLLSWVDANRRNKFIRDLTEAKKVSPRLVNPIKNFLLMAMDADVMGPAGQLSGGEFKPVDVAEKLKELGHTAKGLQLRGFEKFFVFYQKALNALSTAGTIASFIDLLYGLWKVVSNVEKHSTESDFVVEQINVAAIDIQRAFRALEPVVPDQESRISIVESLYRISRDASDGSIGVTIADVETEIRKFRPDSSETASQVSSNVANLLTRASGHMQASKGAWDAKNRALIETANSVMSIIGNVSVIGGSASKNPVVLINGVVATALSFQIFGQSVTTALGHGVIALIEIRATGRKGPIVSAFIRTACTEKIDARVSTRTIIESMFDKLNKD